MASDGEGRRDALSAFAGVAVWGTLLLGGGGVGGAVRGNLLTGREGRGLGGLGGPARAFAGAQSGQLGIAIREEGVEAGDLGLGTEELQVLGSQASFQGGDASQEGLQESKRQSVGFHGRIEAQKCPRCHMTRDCQALRRLPE